MLFDGVVDGLERVHRCLELLDRLDGLGDFLNDLLELADLFGDFLHSLGGGHGPRGTSRIAGTGHRHSDPHRNDGPQDCPSGFSFQLLFLPFSSRFKFRLSRSQCLQLRVQLCRAGISGPLRLFHVGLGLFQ
jgi:hypothetical protein